ncbi:MAG: cobalamin-dependent protein [Chloroflexi bacterium]|nr:cobalamin-dependent protein [Chloroflexota bacterium]
MNVLLIATNRAERYMERMTVRPLPIGLAYLAAHVDEGRHRLEALDLMFSKDALGDVIGAVERFKPDVVGLSIRNLDNQSFLDTVWHLPAIREIVGAIRASCDAKIVCGGPGFSIMPAECLEYLDADLGIAGDAATSFAELLERLESDDGYEDIPGIVYREGGRILASEARLSGDFRRPPRLELLDIARYDRAGFGIGVVTKLAPSYYRGANGKGWPRSEGWRVRPVGEVVEEIAGLHKRFGIRKLFLIDSGFNVAPEYAKALCEAIIESGLRLRWNTYLRPGPPETANAALVSLMKRSGCSLALINDAGEDADALRRIAGLCHEAGLPFTLAFGFGGPGETEASVNRKLEVLRETAPALATLRVGVRVLPGSEAARAALDEGLIASESELIKPTFYLTENARGWLVERLRKEAASNPRWNLL